MSIKIDKSENKDSKSKDNHHHHKEPTLRFSEEAKSPTSKQVVWIIARYDKLIEELDSVLNQYTKYDDIRSEYL